MCNDCVLGGLGAKKAKGRAKKQETQGAGGCSGLPVGIPPTPACTKVWTESPPVQDIQTLPDFKARMDAPWVDSGEKYGALRAGQK